VTFLVGPAKVEIMAHKFTLTMASGVFRTMFHGALPEGNVVTIPKADPEAFRLMLEVLKNEIHSTLLLIILILLQ